MMPKSRSQLWLFVLAALALSPAFAVVEPDHPRIMAIAIGIPVQYDQTAVQKNLSKADVVVLGFWPHWKENENKSARDVVKALKRYNPNILVGQYTDLNEAKDKGNADKTSIDVANKLDKEGWWLKGATGARVQNTTEYSAWDVNITARTQPDANNKRYPQWLAERNYGLFFKNVPELDFWFLDITNPYSPVAIADWDNSGIPVLSTLPAYAKLYRDGHRAYWDTIRSFQPQTLLIGNAQDLTSDEYTGQLNGALFEAAMGLSWSLYERQGWEAVRNRYYSFINNTQAPHIVGFNVWGSPTDYQKMRLGLTTCLLNDGYFSYTDKDKGYNGTVWFDEFDFKIGKAIEPPPQQAWSNGVYRRLYENGAVFVNPTNNVVRISLNNEYKRFSGTQAPSVNSGASVTVLDMPANDGIILFKNSPPAQPVIKAISTDKP